MPWVSRPAIQEFIEQGRNPVARGVVDLDDRSTPVA
jgi:hypothetical protein